MFSIAGCVARQPCQRWHNTTAPLKPQSEQTNTTTPAVQEQARLCSRCGSPGFVSLPLLQQRAYGQKGAFWGDLVWQSELKSRTASKASLSASAF